MMLFSTQDLDELFSEEDDMLLEKKTIKISFSPLTVRGNETIDVSDMANLLEGGYFSHFVSLNKSDYEGDSHMIVTIFFNQIKSVFYVTLVDIFYMENKKDFSEIDIVKYLSIGSENASIFMNHI